MDRFQALARPSSDKEKEPATQQLLGSSRPTTPTSTRSRRPLLASRPCSAKPANGPSPACETSSTSWSISSSRRSAPTTSAPAGTTQT